MSSLNSFSGLLRETRAAERIAAIREVTIAEQSRRARVEPKILITIDPSWAYYGVWAAKSPSGLTAYEIGNLVTGSGLIPTSSPDYYVETGFNRAEPFRGYTSTDGETVQATFNLIAEKNADIAEAIRTEVMLPYVFFKSLITPFRTPNDSITHGPPPVIAVCGEAWTIRGVVTEFNPAPGGDGITDPITSMPLCIECSLTIASARRKLPDFLPGNRRYI